MDGVKLLRYGACLISGGLLIGLIAGCNGGAAGGGGTNARNAAMVQPRDFSDPSIVRHAETPASARAFTPVDDDEADEFTVAPGSPGRHGQAVSTLGAGDSAQGRGGDNGGRTVGRVIVDQKVGQINGEPVYAGQYLQRMEARLRAEATRLGRSDWRALARELIRQDLEAFVSDRLLSAEFRSSMPAEQREGLRYFVEQVRDRQRLLAGGSVQQANETLLAMEGMTLDEKARAIAELEFRREHLRREINSRVHVSRRDIEQYYRQNIDRYAPLPIARFRSIVVPLRNEEVLQRVREAIDRGDDPESIAREFTTIRRETHGLWEFPVSREGVIEVSFTVDSPLYEAARSLEEGGCSDMVVVGANGWWLCFEGFERFEPTPLYEVQGQIEERLRSSRFQELLVAYFRDLESRSNLTDREEMLGRLLEYAEERFFLPAQRDGASATR
ncbi:MAG: hypothetical protein EA380_03725 [Phycisphaeraceae bacterium]|nr:MAG: hypothetical protein EA380_03725 [Phycisphaeraceae bacterium]